MAQRAVNIYCLLSACLLILATFATNPIQGAKVHSRRDSLSERAARIDQIVSRVETTQQLSIQDSDALHNALMTVIEICKRNPAGCSVKLLDEAMQTDVPEVIYRLFGINKEYDHEEVEEDTADTPSPTPEEEETVPHVEEEIITIAQETVSTEPLPVDNEYVGPDIPNGYANVREPVGSGFFAEAVYHAVQETSSEELDEGDETEREYEEHTIRKSNRKHKQTHANGVAPEREEENVEPAEPELQDVPMEEMVAPTEDQEEDEQTRMKKLRTKCKYRKSCYESGVVPVIIIPDNIFVPPVEQPQVIVAKKLEELKNPEDLSELEKKVLCKYRKSCYETGELPDLTVKQAVVTKVEEIVYNPRMSIQMQCHYRKSCYETGKLPEYFQRKSNVVEEEIVNETSEPTYSAPPSDKQPEEVPEEEELSELKKKLFCKYRKSCYETGELPDLTIKPVIAMKVGEVIEEVVYNPRVSMQMRCHYRKSCYETGELPEQFQRKGGVVKEDIIQETETQIDEEPAHRGEEEHDKEPEDRGEEEHDEEPEDRGEEEHNEETEDRDGEEHGEEPEDRGEEEHNEETENHDGDEHGEEPEDRGEEHKLRKKTKSHKTHKAPKPQENMQSHKAEKRKCKYRKSCLSEKGIEDADETVEPAARRMHLGKATAIKQGKRTTNTEQIAKQVLEETKQSEIEAEELKAMLRNPYILTQWRLAAKAKCKYRKSCYETGQVPKLEPQVSLIPTFEVPGEEVEEVEEVVELSELDKKRVCKYRKSCYQSGVVPELVYESQFTMGSLFKAQDLELTQDQPVIRFVPIQLRCKYRKSCYETGELPEELQKQVSSDAGPISVKPLPTTPEELKRYCKYRKSCYHDMAEHMKEREVEGTKQEPEDVFEAIELEEPVKIRKHKIKMEAPSHITQSLDKTVEKSMKKKSHKVRSALPPTPEPEPDESSQEAEEDQLQEEIESAEDILEEGPPTADQKSDATEAIESAETEEEPSSKEVEEPVVILKTVAEYNVAQNEEATFVPLADEYAEAEESTKEEATEPPTKLEPSSKSTGQQEVEEEPEGEEQYTEQLNAHELAELRHFRNMGEKLRCHYRLSCYKTGEVPNLQVLAIQEEPKESEDEDEEEDELMKKLKCRYRKSCYETGVVPDLTPPPVVIRSRTELAVETIHQTMELKCKYRKSCYESGELPVELRRREESERSVPKVLPTTMDGMKRYCKYRKSCYGDYVTMLQTIASEQGPQSPPGEIPGKSAQPAGSPSARTTVQKCKPYQISCRDQMKREGDSITMADLERNATKCNKYRLSCREQMGLPPKEKAPIGPNGKKLCRKKRNAIGPGRPE